MKMRLVIAPDGRVGFFSRTGTFIEGKAAIEELMKLFSANGLNLADVSIPEQHRHDGNDKLLAGTEDLHVH